MSPDKFVPAAPRPMPESPPLRADKPRRGLLLPAAALGIIVLLCLGCELFIPRDPRYIDLASCNVPPCREFLFGTDSLGRDIFSMLWYGGRVSLGIGLASAALSTLLAVVLGSLAGLAPAGVERFLARANEIILSVPNLLLVLLIQALLGKPGAASIALVLGLTGWMSMARVVRTLVRQLRQSGYVLSSQCMGGGFFHVLTRHLAPNFLPSISYMAVMNVRAAIAAESTLSFMGLGLPPEMISWGSMLSLAENALTGRQWWIILIPGLFLAVTLLCLTALGSAMQDGTRRRHSNL
ncbi:MAG: ABC transporter permease [Butyricicoccus sp.]|nr:ABC transporter permease [Butyricicoccus sp.]